LALAAAFAPAGTASQGAIDQYTEQPPAGPGGSGTPLGTDTEPSQPAVAPPPQASAPPS